MDTFQTSAHPVRGNIIGPSNCGKSVFLTNSIPNNTDENEEKHIYSPFFCQIFFQKRINVLVIT